METNELAGKVAVVTGGGTGIGAAIAERFAREGACVAITGRRLHLLEQVAAAINAENGQRCLAVQADVAQEEDVDALFDRVAAAFGPVDGLVNNAAIAGEVGPIEDISLASWEEALGSNLTGPWLCARAAARQMVPRRTGKIITIGSISGKRPLANRTPYCATKMAMVGLTRSLALELGPHNINVNLISPGMVDTPRLTELAEKYKVSPETIREESAKKRCLNRVPTTTSIADLAVFLAGERSRDITGIDITVDAGGWFT